MYVYTYITYMCVYVCISIYSFIYTYIHTFINHFDIIIDSYAVARNNAEQYYVPITHYLPKVMIPGLPRWH